jgi:hypothetical protein
LDCPCLHLGHWEINVELLVDALNLLHPRLLCVQHLIDHHFNLLDLLPMFDFSLHFDD